MRKDHRAIAIQVVVVDDAGLAATEQPSKLSLSLSLSLK